MRLRDHLETSFVEFPDATNRMDPQMITLVFAESPRDDEIMTIGESGLYPQQTARPRPAARLALGIGGTRTPTRGV